MNVRVKKLPKNLVGNSKGSIFASVLKTASRGGAVVARWAHNPKAGGSIPSPATKDNRFYSRLSLFLSLFLSFPDKRAQCKIMANRKKLWSHNNKFYEFIMRKMKSEDEVPALSVFTTE